MLTPVDLHHQLGRQAYEVGHVDAERVLSAKLEVDKLLAPQRSPKLPLGIRHAAPQVLWDTTGLYSLIGLAEHLLSPSSPCPLLEGEAILGQSLPRNRPCARCGKIDHRRTSSMRAAIIGGGPNARPFFPPIPAGGLGGAQVAGVPRR